MLGPILAAVLYASGPQSVDACQPIPGWEELIDERDPSYIVIGEAHGTNEMPELFADAVCLTAHDGPVAVALEVPDPDQPQIDAFLASDGGEEARSALLETLLFQNTFKDGRSSEAMVTLMQTLRRMYQAGAISGVTAFQYWREGEDLTSGEYEERLAELVRSAPVENEPVLVLVGGAHARTSEISFGGTTYMPMAGHLPREQTLALRIIENGGEAWACTGMPVMCGVSGGPDRSEQFERGVRLSERPDFPWDGVLLLGTRTSASLPAE